MLVAVSALAFWLVERALAPFPVIVDGLERLQRGELGFRLPQLRGLRGARDRRRLQPHGAERSKTSCRPSARRARRARASRSVASWHCSSDQRVEEERRLIAHELHDEFGQSVTAIRSLALAIATQGGARDPVTGEAARLISDEAARLYDAMHGLIPRLAPLSLDTLGLAATLESLVRDWQRRHPALAPHAAPRAARRLGASVTLAAYRVVQEGLSTPLRHAQPTRVEIEVTSDGAAAASSRSPMTASGCRADWSRPGHFGLRGLAERVERLGGTFDVVTASRTACDLTAEIPLVEVPGMIRVLLVDDHAVVRTGFRLLLQAHPEITVVGEADSGEAACQLLRRARPRRRGHGPRHARHGRPRGAAAHPRAPSAGAHPRRSRRTMTRCTRGARCARARCGFLSKRSAPEALLEAITAVAAGRRYLDAGLAQKLALAELRRRPASRRSSGSRSGSSRCSCAWRGGATVQRIAQDLKLSASTIGTHLYNIKQKLRWRTSPS